MKKSASATWTGTVKEGDGSISTESGALSKQPFGFNTRFNHEPGTNPEELIGGAHAGCFVMAFANALGEHDITPDHIGVDADITLENKDGGFVITKSELAVTLDAGSGSDENIQKAFDSAKAACPVSNVLNADVSVSLTRK